MKICFVSPGIVSSAFLRANLKASGRKNQFKKAWFGWIDFASYSKATRRINLRLPDIYIGSQLELTCTAQAELGGRPYMALESIAPHLHMIDVHYLIRQRIDEFYQLRLKERVQKPPK
jgi:hypothetical protein